MPLKGLYIEDDPSNILTYKELFAPEGLEILLSDAVIGG